MQTLVPCTEIIIFHFFALENIKKTPSKLAHFSFCWDVSILPKTAQSAQAQKNTRFIWVVWSRAYKLCPILSIMNIKGIDCTNQYFTLRKRICHGKWHDGKRIDCEGNHSHCASNTNMPRQSRKLVFYTRTTFFYMHLSWSMGITAPFFKRT